LLEFDDICRRKDDQEFLASSCELEQQPVEAMMSQPAKEPRPKPYGFAPEEPVYVSPAANCTTKLTKEKKQAVKTYIRDLGPELQKKYGKKPHYTPEQVRETALVSALSVDYMCWAYLLYCSQPVFHSIHSAAGEACDYTAMREVVAGTFFGGNLGFDAIELAATIAAGSTEAIASTAGSAVGWLADVDWSGLLDWS
jgi:hypothetical protein